MSQSKSPVGSQAGPHGPPPEPEQVGFSAAMAELDNILIRIEREEIDIDQLAVELARAAQLVELCRGKLRRAELEVTQILGTIDEGSNP